MRERHAVRVAFLYGFPLGVGGVEAHILALAEHRWPWQFDAIVLGPATEGFRGQLEGLGSRVVDWREPRLRFDPRSVLSLASIFRKNSVDIVHVQSPRWLLHTCLAARLAKSRTVATVHLPLEYLVGRTAQHGFGRWARHLFHRAVSAGFVDFTIFVSSSVRRQSLEDRLVTPNRSIFIPNGVGEGIEEDSEARDAIRNTTTTPREAVVACFVGRLEGQKGVDVLIHAFKEAAVQCPLLHLWITGEGPQGEHLRALVERIGLGDRTRFLGHRSDVSCVLAGADVFVLPSRFEGMPVALLEAIARGLPCIVTDVGDSASIVRDGVEGRVISPGNCEGLARALGELADDAALRRGMGEAARVRSGEYGIEAMVREHDTLYRSLISESRTLR